MNTTNLSAAEALVIHLAKIEASPATYLGTIEMDCDIPTSLLSKLALSNDPRVLLAVSRNENTARKTLLYIIAKTTEPA
jgi:hypothetical protein